MDYSFETYLIIVGIRSLEFTYSDVVLFENIDYFRKSHKENLSAYKTLLFLHDFLEEEGISTSTNMMCICNSDENCMFDSNSYGDVIKYCMNCKCVRNYL